MEGKVMKKRAHSAKRQVTQKLQQAIEKNKRKLVRGPRDIKKKMATKKPTDLEGEEITSNESGDDNKNKDDFFMDEEEGKHSSLNSLQSISYSTPILTSV